MSDLSFENLASPGVRGLAPYQPGKPISELERELGLGEIVKLASNENPLGPNPAVLEAIRESLAEVARYPDGNGFALKSALMRRLGVGIDQITLGNGSNDVLDLIARVFLVPATEAVFSRHAFAIYDLVTRAAGARSVIAPATDGQTGPRYGHDLKAMAARITDRTRVVFIANPNNPTGTYLSSQALEGFVEALPARVLCVIDEAYFEYVEATDYGSMLALISRHPNLVVTRTFSKAYGLAGLRVGFAVSHPRVAELLNRVRQPFNVNGLALRAAEVALEENDHLIRIRQLNRAGLAQLTRGLADLGLDCISSVANFVCVDVGCPAGPVFDALLRRGVIVRPVGGYDLPTHLRVTVGTEDENRRFLEALQGVLRDG